MENDNLTTYECLFIFTVFLFLIGMGKACFQQRKTPPRQQENRRYG